MLKKIKILTKSTAETKKIGEWLAARLVRSRASNKCAIVISLEGELGAGKTTFTQGFARGLGTKENPRSPTFVLMRAYSLPPPNSTFVRGRKKEIPFPLTKGEGRVARVRGYWRFSNFIHIDAYRINSRDLKTLGWGDFVKNKENIILIEWGNRVKNILPKNAARVIFKHAGHSSERLIKLKNP